ncbi:SEC-C domain-containing protein, partial [Actinomycetospora chlora]|uniref:SEC-C domain-containing protein n=1 Tax=Actinomycetospora chlora TaxID=663608 RepID=UPI0031EB4C62
HPASEPDPAPSGSQPGGPADRAPPTSAVPAAAASTQAAPTGRSGRGRPGRGPAPASQRPGNGRRGQRGQHARAAAEPDPGPTTAAGPALSQLGQTDGAMPDAFRGAGLGGRRSEQLNYSGPDEDGHAARHAAGNGDSRAARANPQQARRSDAPSRNAPCPCGSGRKYKQCHGAPPRSPG